MVAWPASRLPASAGIVVLLGVWALPLTGLVPVPFARHMLVDVAVLAVASPLIAIGLAGSPAARALALVSPVAASGTGFAALWLWHVPLLHGLADLSPMVRALEGLSLLGAGLLLWTSALRAADPGEETAGILALLLTAIHVLLLGTLLALAWRPLYTQDIRTLGDVYAHLVGQRAGGMVLLLAGGVHLAGGLWLLGRLLRPAPARVTASALDPGAGTEVAAPALSEGGDLP